MPVHETSAAANGRIDGRDLLRLMVFWRLIGCARVAADSDQGLHQTVYTVLDSQRLCMSVARQVRAITAGKTRNPDRK